MCSPYGLVTSIPWEKGSCIQQRKKKSSGPNQPMTVLNKLWLIQSSDELELQMKSIIKLIKLFQFLLPNGRAHAPGTVSVLASARA